MNDALLEVHNDTFEIPEAGRLLCLLLSMGSERAAVLDGIDEAQWNEVVRLAANFQLTSVLYYNLKRLQKWARLPDSVRSALSEGHLTNDATAMALQYRLGQVLRLFSQRGLPVIVLKGAFLAQVVYLHDSGRMMCDVDLLVPKALIEDAIAALRSIGYVSALNYPAQEDFTFRHHAPPFSQDGFPTIELHWELIFADHRFSIDAEGVWQRAQPVAIAGEFALALSPEDLLLHLCIHAANHHLRGGLRATYDIALSVDHYSREIDWVVLIARARQWKAGRSVFLMLSLAEDLFGASIPVAVLSACRPDDFDPALLDLSKRLVFFDKPDTQPLPEHVVMLQNTPGIWGKLRILWGRFFPPTNEIALHFVVSPRSWRVWLYYPLRWRELFATQFKWVWKLWRGDPATHQRAQVDAQRLEQEEHLADWLKL